MCILISCYFKLRETAVEAEAEREKQLLNSRLAQLETNLRIKEESEQEIKSKLLETVSAVEKVIKCLSYKI